MSVDTEKAPTVVITGTGGNPMEKEPLQAKNGGKNPGETTSEFLLIFAHISPIIYRISLRLPIAVYSAFPVGIPEQLSYSRHSLLQSCHRRSLLHNNSCVYN